MSDARTKISDYVEELISAPRSHLRMELRQDKNGLSLLHDGRALVECSLTRDGMMSAGFMAQALGAKIPPLGGSTPVRASTGLLFRAVSIAALDFANEESLTLLERLLEDAEAQRGASSDAV